MSGIYQVYTIIINFLGFPDVARVCFPGPVEIWLARPTRNGCSGPWACSS